MIWKGIQAVRMLEQKQQINMALRALGAWSVPLFISHQSEIPSFVDYAL
jgi:hypothetical protein